MSILHVNNLIFYNFITEWKEPRHGSQKNPGANCAIFLTWARFLTFLNFTFV